MFLRRTMLRNLLLPPHFFTIALILSVNSLLFSSCYSIDEQGRALLTWKNNLTSPTDALSSWNLEAPTPCSWLGIICDPNGQVIQVALRSMDLHGTLPTNLHALKFLSIFVVSSTNITGPIPKEFGDYRELTVLDLTENYLLGKVPEEICRLSKLQDLSLHGNELDGNIPSEIGNLTNLEYLQLSDNNFIGEIPKSIGMLKKLYHFKLGGNKYISGMLPMEIGNCSSLSFLGLPETGLTGLPSSIGMMTSLQSIAIYNSQLSGSIPEEIGNCSELHNIYLYNNKLSGLVPRGIGKLKNLQNVNLWMNKLEGGIPEEIGNCKELVVLDISDNLLDGSIPKSIGQLSNLQELQLSNNQMTGTLPSEISNCVSLVHMEIDNNKLSGEIPASLGNLKNLNLFYAWQNKLTGSIPSTISGCLTLQSLDLSFNQLSGELPKEMFTLQNLTKVLLMSNNLSGIIPLEIEKCTNLYRLRLATNRIGGTIPSEIGNLKNLTFLDIAENLLVGGIPPSLARSDCLQLLDLHSNGLTSPLPNDLPKKLQVLDMSNNRLTGQVNPSIGGLTNLTKLVLRNNQLSGKIPGEIISCKKLQSLDLSNNRFSGELPKELGQIVSLEISLNLSNNQFSGEIPFEFSSLTKLGMLDLSHNNLSGNLSHLVQLENLVSLNISYNNFSGKLPDTMFFQKLPLHDIAGNKDLYVSNDLVTITNKLISNGSRDVIKVGLPILIGISAVLFFLAIYMLIRTHMANSIPLTEDEKWEITMFQKLEFSIEDILHNLSSSNVIGTGSSGVVYRVTTPNGGNMAVKKIWATEETGAFNTEIQTLGSIRHKNIIRLLGWGTNRNSKLLFYDYLPNGSLSSLIHGDGEGGAEWEVRYEALLGVAHALAYLHHDCAPAISHGDVKSMNVLLGHNFEPYLADFGLAKNVGTNSEDIGSEQPSLRPQLAGSFGYMAPEQGSMTRVTEKSDVYSFGVMIMEVLTGRHPLDPTLPGEANLVQWVQDHLATSKIPVAIFDSNLKGRTDPIMQEMLQTLAVASICVSVKPDDRPPMKDVVAMLEEIRHVESGRAAADNPKLGKVVVVVQSPPPSLPPEKFLSYDSS